MTRTTPLGLAATPRDLAARVLAVRTAEAVRLWASLPAAPHADRDEPLGLDDADAWAVLAAPHAAR